MEWIKCTDRLPDEPGRYLVLLDRKAPDNLGGDERYVTILRFLDEGKFRLPVHMPKWINDAIHEEVTHWMALPKLPEDAQ